MNQIIDNYSEIIEFAKGYGLPITKKRAILREYLQSKILNLIYQNSLSLDYYFIGGTSLRLLRGLDRFSEDLDFDLLEKDLKALDLNVLAEKLKDDFAKKYLLPIAAKVQGKTRIYLKFPILKDLGLAEKEESDQLFVKIEPMKSLFEKPEI